MKKKVLIISGGISKERTVSLETGKQVAKELTKFGYRVKISEPNFKLFDVIKKFKPNFIFFPTQKKILLNEKKIIFDNYALVELKRIIDKKINNKNSIILTTSGTTSNPKFVRISNQNIFKNTYQIQKYLIYFCCLNIRVIYQ